MKKLLLITNLIIIVGLIYVAFNPFILIDPKTSGAPPYGDTEEEVPNLDPHNWFSNWERPDGPVRVGLQVGHLENDKLPEELDRLIGNTGATGRGISEATVNSNIAEETKKILEGKGIAVDIIPATVPPSYVADAFIAIHADGNLNKNVSGYKIAGPWRDWSNKSDTLVTKLEESYSAATGLIRDENISSNMRGYYAFSWWRYKHAVHPMTPSVIVETGFLTNPGDQVLLIDNPQIPAIGIADGIIKFLQKEGLIS